MRIKRVYCSYITFVAFIAFIAFFSVMQILVYYFTFGAVFYNSRTMSIFLMDEIFGVEIEGEENE